MIKVIIGGQIMKKKTLFFLLAITVLPGLGTMAKGELINRGKDNSGNNLVYDTDLDITWYDYSYFAPEYQDAVTWVNHLSVKMGTTEFTDWRLPSVVKGEDYSFDSPYRTEMGHLYLVELINNEVLYPWNFPNVWRDFDRLIGGYYWMRKVKDQKGMETEGSREAPAFDSKERKLQFIPVVGANRPKDNRYTFFRKKKKYLAVAVHSGDIVQKLLKH